MKLSLYPKLAVDGIRKNKRLYLRFLNPTSIDSIKQIENNQLLEGENISWSIEASNAICKVANRNHLNVCRLAR